MAQRHPATVHLLAQFDYGHLPLTLQNVSAPLHTVAHQLAGLLADGPELSDGLRNLLRAKDSFVRQRVADLKAAQTVVPQNTPEPEIEQPIPAPEVEAPPIVAQPAQRESLDPR